MLKILLTHRSMIMDVTSDLKKTILKTDETSMLKVLLTYRSMIMDATSDLKNNIIN
ncbi:hypothetical protein [Mariniflexile rhizosphaerae]|uniref:hypothetical protein n=1 Tax=unclassified Mariniflexile TaxID=2643887 RepID=UPI0013C3785C|nr:hypothetical protein [Mariniflexile sp. TRM1-10]